MSMHRLFVKISVCCMIVFQQCETANTNRIGKWFKTKYKIRELVDSRADKTDDTFQQRLSFKKSANEDCLPPHELEGQIRLAGGSEFYGRVEIYHNGEWGTVCDDDFTVSSAQVVCRQLGYRGGRVDTSVPAGRGRTWMDGVRCSGSEQRLSSCDFNGWGIEDCSHSEDVGVHCDSLDSTLPPLYEGKIRLVEGRTELDGRLEIYHDGRWGTVCDDSFTKTNAEVVCRQLGHSGGTFSTQVPAGSGVTWMDEVNCRGTEARLSDCRFDGWGREDCSHDEDVGVICSDIDTPAVQDGDIRLVGGRSEYEGRVEIYHDNQWGTVCDDSWGAQDAQVVCRQLNFTGGIAKTEAYFGRGNDPTWLDDVHCSGSETRLSECRFRGWGYEDCGHSEDAGVVCSPPTTTVETTTQQMEITTAMAGCHNDSMYECYGNGNCIPIDQMCDGEQNCVDGSDENVCNNNDDIISERGGVASFVCAASYSTVGKVVSWFHINTATNETELISMDDFIFASNGNFSAHRLNQRVFILKLYGVEERNTGVYECHIDDVEIVAKHQLSLQEGCPNDSNFECNGNCIPIDQMCDGEQNCVDGSDENVCNNNDSIISERGGVASFVCAASYSTVGKVVSWFHVNTATNEKELLSMDDVIFASNGNFSAYRINQRVFMLKLYGVEERNTGVYECLIDDVEIVAKHQLSLQEGGGGGEPNCASQIISCSAMVDNVEGGISEICSAAQNFITCVDNLPPQCLVGNNEIQQAIESQRRMFRNMCGVIGGGLSTVAPTVGPNEEVDCLTESTNCFMILSSMGHNGDISQMCSVSRRFMACAESLPMSCLAGQQLQQSLEQQRDMLITLCGGYSETTTPTQPPPTTQAPMPSTQEPDEVDCLTDSTSCFTILSAIGNNADISLICRVTRRFIGCVESLPQICLEGQEALQQSLQQQRNMMNVLCGGILLTTTAGPVVVSDNTTLEIEYGEGDGGDCDRNAVLRCTVGQVNTLANLSGPSTDPDVRNQVCSSINEIVTCLQPLLSDCPMVDFNFLQNPYIVDYCSPVRNETGDGCKSDDVVECYFHVFKLSSEMFKGGSSDLCSHISMEYNAEDNIMAMFNFLTDNILFVIGGSAFQKTIAIPMCTSCAPLLADLFLYSYEAEFIQTLLSNKQKKLATSFNFTFSNSNLEPTITCFKQLPETCALDQQVRTLTEAFTSSCGNASRSTQAPLSCRFHEFAGKTAMVFGGFAMSSSSVWNVDECKRVCEDSNCAGFEFDPHESGVGGSCSLFEENSIAALVTVPNKIFYKKDCAESDQTCGAFGETRCNTGECIRNGDICDFIRDCSDGSDEADCETKSVALEYESNGVVILKFRGKTVFFCDNGSFQQASVNVVCKSAGYRYGYKSTTSHTMVYPDAWALVECEGTETNLFDCPVQVSPDGNCRNQKPVAVTCNN